MRFPRCRQEVAMATTVQQQPRAGGAVAAPDVVGKRGLSFTPYLFILPHLIFFAVFVAYPFFNGLVISAYRYDYLTPDRNVFVGLGNYLDLFTSGTPEFQTFWPSLGNTAFFVVISVPPLVVIPLLLAVLLNVKIPGRNIFRALYFSPWVLSVAVVSLLWWWIFQSEGGLLNYYLGQLHLGTPQWLSTLPWAWVA